MQYPLAIRTKISTEVLIEHVLLIQSSAKTLHKIGWPNKKNTDAENEKLNEPRHIFMLCSCYISQKIPPLLSQSKIGCSDLRFVDPCRMNSSLS